MATGSMTLGSNITTGGNVGIGTAAPGHALTIQSASTDASNPVMTFALNRQNSATESLLMGVDTNTNAAISVNGGADILFGANASGNTVFTERMRLTNSGSLGLGTASPGAQLHTTGSVRMANFGSGAATFDASGNISSVSDERFKDIQRNFTAGLKELAGIKPIVYKWNEKSGMEMEHEYAGFSAQNVRDHLVEASHTKAVDVSIGKQVVGTKIDESGLIVDDIQEVFVKDTVISLQDRALVAALVNSVNELRARVEELEIKVSNLP